MTIFIDADSCPAACRAIVERRAAKEKIQLVYAANRKIPFNAEHNREVKSGLFIMEVCGTAQNAQEGAADDYIAKNAAQGDIAVTRDVPLALRLVEKGIRTIDDRGREFTKDNIRYYLSMRDANIALAVFGGSREASYGEREKKDFANTLDKAIIR